MCPSLIQIGSKTAEKTAQTNKQTDKQTDRHYENNGHLAVNQNIYTTSMFYGCLNHVTLSLLNQEQSADINATRV